MIVIDSNTIIGLVSNCYLWILKKFYEKYKKKFYITSKIYEEVIINGMKNYCYVREPFFVLNYINEGVIEIINTEDLDKDFEELKKYINDCANRVYYYGNKNYIEIMHEGELELISLLIYKKWRYLATDERILRTFIEDPIRLKSILEGRLHRKIYFNEDLYYEIKEYLYKIKVVRSIDMLAKAIKDGFFDKVFINSYKYLLDKYSIEDLAYYFVLGNLFSLKMKGCGVSTKVIKTYAKYLSKILLKNIENYLK